MERFSLEWYMQKDEFVKNCENEDIDRLVFSQVFDFRGNRFSDFHGNLGNVREKL